MKNKPIWSFDNPFDKNIVSVTKNVTEKVEIAEFDTKRDKVRFSHGFIDISTIKEILNEYENNKIKEIANESSISKQDS